MIRKSQLKFNRKLGAKLLQARLESGLEQKELGLKIGKTQSYISKIESGDIKLDLYSLLELTKVYNKPIEYFISK